MSSEWSPMAWWRRLSGRKTRRGRRRKDRHAPEPLPTAVRPTRIEVGPAPKGWWPAMVAFSVLLALLLVWPMPLEPVHQVVGHPEASVGCHVWVIWWAQHHLGEPFTDLIFYPNGADVVQLYGSDLLSPLLLAWIPASPVLLYNLWVVFLLALGGVGAGFLARHAGASPQGAFVGTVVFAAAPFFQHELLNGTSELISAGLLPWFVVVLLQTVEAPTVKRGALVGLIAGVAIALSAYNPFFVLLIVVVALGHRAATTLGRIFTPELLRAVGAAAAVGGLFVLPIGWLHLAHGATETLARRSTWTEQEPPLPDSFAQLSDWLDPRPVVLPELTSSLHGGVFEYWTTCTVFLGFVALLLALYGAWRRHDRATVSPGLLWSLFLVGALIASGPWLRVFGEWVTVFGLRVPLPGLTVAELFPPFLVTAMHSYRYTAVVVTALSALAARGVGHPIWAVLVMVELLVLSPVPRADAVTPVPPSPVLERLAEMPAGAVLTAPSQADDLGDLGRLLLAQTVHGHPVHDGGMHERAGKGARALFYENALVDQLSDPRSPEWPGQPQLWFSALHEVGYRYLLVPVGHAEAQVWAEAVLGEPDDKDNVWALWTLSESDQ